MELPAEDQRYKFHGGAKFTKDYITFRPVYPQVLWDTILSYHRESPNSGFDLAVDVACGSGQATVPLAEYFNQVIGVDISKDQMDNAPKDISNITYKEARGEELPFIKTGSVDLVTIAILQRDEQNHKTSGTFVTLTYLFPTLDNKPANDYIQGFFNSEAPKYHKEEFLKFVKGEYYSTLVTPFKDRNRRDDIELQLKWTIDQMLGFIQSMTTTKDIINDYSKNDRDLIAELKEKMTSLLGDQKTFTATFKVHLLMLRKPIM